MMQKSLDGIDCAPPSPHRHMQQAEARAIIPLATAPSLSPIAQRSYGCRQISQILADVSEATIVVEDASQALSGRLKCGVGGMYVKGLSSVRDVEIDCHVLVTWRASINELRDNIGLSIELCTNNE